MPTRTHRSTRRSSTRPARIGEDGYRLDEVFATVQAEGFATPAAIGSTPRALFLRGVADKIGEPQALRLHAAAEAQSQYLNSVIAGARAASASRHDLAPELAAVASIQPQPCACRDCEAAVSPTAYLADLLDYALKHVVSTGRPAASAARSMATVPRPLGSLLPDGKLSLTLTPPATPTISPAAGTFSQTVSVTLATTTTAASIYYTLDGSDPDESSRAYTSPVVLRADLTPLSVTVRAVAVRGALGELVYSQIASASFVINPLPQAADPVITPNGGTFTGPVSVSLTCPTAGAQLRYTLDGSDPTGASTLYSAPLSLTAGATLSVRAFVGGLRDSTVRRATFIINNDAGVGTGNGLVGEYYDRADFTDLKLTRQDAVVDFAWGLDAPDPSIGPDAFSVRWTGQVQPRFTDTYTFSTVSDDGVRLWVDGRLLIDNWTDHVLTENSASIALQAGCKYAIKLEFYENGGSATIRLLWSTPSQSKGVVPTAQLYSRLARPINLSFLTTTLYQDFDSLPATCDAVDERVRQVRLCIEVLRRYLTVRSLPAVGSSQRAELDANEKAYRLAAYAALLTGLGTSLEEVRLARAADAATRQALAQRLGLELDPARPDDLDALYLDPALLTEAALERVTGLVDTTRDPLSDGLVLAGTPAGQITRWQLNGVVLGTDAWANNVDLEGRLFGRLTRVSATEVRFELFRDRARTILVASGSSPTAVGTIVLAEANASGLSGSVKINYIGDSTDIELAVAPALLAAQLRHLRRQWTAQDFPTDAYTPPTSQTRTNVAAASAGATPNASSVVGAAFLPSGAINGDRKGATWGNNGGWNDGTLNSFPDWIQVAFAGMRTIDEIDVFTLQDDFPHAIEPTPELTFTKYGITRFDVQYWTGSAWITVPGGSVNDNTRVWRRFTFPPLSTSRIRVLVRGSVDGYSRVVEIEAYTPGSEATDDQLPVVDPDVIGPDDFRLPATKAASAQPDRAFDLWVRRRTWVDARLAAFAALQKTVQVSGQPQTVPDLNAMLVALTQPVTYASVTLTAWSSDVPSSLDLLLAQLAGAPSDAQTAGWRITRELKLDLDAFRRLMELRARDQQASPGPTDSLSPDEWQEIWSILTQVQKKIMFPAWRAEEQAAAVALGPSEFWIALREPADGAWPPLQPAATPLVDPERVALADLADLPAGRRARAMWRARRSRLDEMLREVAALATLDAKLKLAFGDPLPADLDQLAADLQSTDPAVVAAATAKVTNVLHLSVKAFGRLMVLKSRASLSAAEWTEVHTILTSARKVRQEYPGWLAVENQTATRLVYWAALKAALPHWRALAAVRAAWQQALRTRSRPPIIDPDVIGTLDLKSTTVGEPAYALWSTRRDWLSGTLKDLQTARQAATSPLGGFDAITTSTLFGPELSCLAAQLDGVRASGGFQALLNEAYADRLPDLDGVLADLGSGGSGVNTQIARAIIRQTLGMTDEAFITLMQFRGRDRVGPPLTAAEWASLERSLAQAMLVVGFRTLPDQRPQGLDLSRRLDQLNLDRPALARLLQIRDLLVHDQAVVDAEWADVYAILTAVAKRRRFGTWRQEEQTQNLTLGPDSFRIPPIDASVFPPPPPPELPAWRADRQTRSDWVDTLRGRIDQHAGAASALHEILGAAEQVALPQLRDALITASDAQGTGLDQRGRWLAERLLIDTAASGRELTTRIAQAIATVQGLLLATRTGQIQDTYPELSLVADDFEAAWEWLGAYATWRAAMFVFLYPENVLLPQLQRWQTPAFRDLVSSVRASRRLTPRQARDLAHTYVSYIRQVSSLVPVAVCHARTPLSPGSAQQHYLSYLFAYAGQIGRSPLLWSAYDPQSTTGYTQSAWESVPGVETGSIVLGAVPYAITPDARFIYLFLSAPDQDGWKIVYLRYNLQSREWEDRPVDLKPPEHSQGTSNFVIAQSASETTPPHVAMMANTSGAQAYDLYHLRFYNDGTPGAWVQIVPRPGSVAGSGPSFDGPLAMIEFGGTQACLFGWGTDTAGHNGLWARLLGGTNQWIFVAAAMRYSSTKAFVWPGTSDLYVFFIQSDGSLGCRVLLNGGTTVSGALPVPAGLINLQVPSGSLPNDVPGQFVCQAFGTPYQYGPWRFTFARAADNSLSMETPTRIAPRISDLFELTDLLTATQRTERRALTQTLLEANSDCASNAAYIFEAFYLVPVHLALQLQQRGEFISAGEWLRTVYDRSRPVGDRKIYYGLVQEENLSAVYERTSDWLLDPLNPHAIAATRANTYTRFTLQCIARCLLDYADEEFTRDTAESVPRARDLYMSALDVLEAPELKQSQDTCDAVIGTLEIGIPGDSSARAIAALRADLRRVNDPAQLQQVVRKISTPLDGRDVDMAIAEARQLIATAQAKPRATATLGDILDQSTSRLARAHNALLRQPALSVAAGRVSERFNTLSNGSSDHRDGHGMTAGPGSGLKAPLGPLGFAPTVSFWFCIPPNPVLKGLRLGGEISLYKLRNCRNIAGLERELEPYSAPTDTTSGLPSLGAGGQLVLPGLGSLRPTPYRYQTLIERAKQLVALSQQMEAAFLSTLERRDAEYVNLLKARQDLRLARAGVRLQDLRTQEADDGVQLATLQQQRAQLQVDHYQGLLDEDTTALEDAALASLIASGTLHVAASVIGGVSAASHFSSAVAAGSTGIGAGVAAQENAAGWSAVIGTLSSAAAAAATASSVFSTLASYERRRDDWQFQKSLAQKDVELGFQQLTLAQDHRRIVAQEYTIATMQAESAEAIADFLATKFTNVELYDWMSTILERVFSFFLQQATAVAQQAQAQLAFERQEPPPTYIQADYWQTRNEGDMGGSAAGDIDRRGMTGSARLLQDVYQLEQYALDTDKRKLQLSETFSLARLAPAEFQRFRETGVLPFATAMDEFDHHYPGHYLRLIKRVRTSVVALVPPQQGIHATLSSRGTSRVVIGGDVYQTLVLRRAPETMALSSPRDTSGVSELEPRPDMLLPFEGLGVDAAWEFRMPRAANQFDYSTIADVLITIEYTALDSYEYAQQVRARLDDKISADRSFSFRHQLQDQWYDLHNPDQSGQPMTVSFSTQAEDFPSNVADLKIDHVLLAFGRSNGTNFEVPVTSLRFTEQGAQAAVGGGATSVGGVISTRRGNASSWTAMLGRSPIGRWELALPDDDEMRGRFQNQEIDDLLFVLSYSGLTPAWPA